MPPSYLLSPMAEADLEAIWTYTAREWSGQQAEAYTNAIIDLFEALAEGRAVGRPRLCARAISKPWLGNMRSISRTGTT